MLGKFQVSSFKRDPGGGCNAFDLSSASLVFLPLLINDIDLDDYEHIDLNININIAREVRLIRERSWWWLQCF